MQQFVQICVCLVECTIEVLHLALDVDEENASIRKADAFVGDHIRSLGTKPCEEWIVIARKQVSNSAQDDRLEHIGTLFTKCLEK